MGSDKQQAEADEPVGRVLHWLSRLALLAVALLVLALSARLVASHDLGYHLAFGETFLDSGRPVDFAGSVYNLAEDPSGEGPGNWRDEHGRYRFPNANWLSQVAMAAVWRTAGGQGPTALSLLLVAIVAAIFFTTYRAVRRAGVPVTWAAAGLLLLAFLAQTRFELRPEVFGYLCISAQLLVLLPVALRETPLTWRRTALLVLLQLLLVNFHSYFLIGLSLTLAILADRLIRVWAPGLGGPAPDGEDARAQAKRLAALFGLQAVACLVNPWGWRLAWLPVQTLLFMRRHGVMHVEAQGEPHPWASIAELASPFGHGWGPATAALLAIALGAAAIALIRRNWGLLLLLLGMAAIGTSFRRNLSVAALLIVPLALVLLHDLLEVYLSRRRAVVETVLAGTVILVSIAVIPRVVTHRFYDPSGSVQRFGLGLSRMNIPLGSAAWIDENLAEHSERLWTDFNSSSNLHYFTDPHRQVPLLTNTWAMPPGAMRQVLRVNRGAEPFSALARRLDLRVVALEVDDPTEPLAVELAWDPDWALVYLDAVHTVFLRVGPETADIVRRFAITPASLDVAAHRERLRAIDPLPVYGLYRGAYTLARLGALDPAVTLLREVVAESPGHKKAWGVLGTSLGMRGQRRAQGNDPRGVDDVREARDCFRRVLEIDPVDEHSLRFLAMADQFLGQSGD